MAQISPQDVLYITILQRGTTCIEATMTGMSSYSDVVGAVRSMAPGMAGMATLNVRNSTCGWADRRVVVIK